VATIHYNPRAIGVVAGCLSTTTAFFWLWAQLAGKLVEPSRNDAGEVTKAENVVPA
jgi:hypothetical protein